MNLSHPNVLGFSAFRLSGTLLLLSVLSLLAIGCQPTESDPPSEPAAAEAPTEEAADAVTYEPAYPAEVSEEGLTEADTARQKAEHSHDGDEHSHGDGSHTHDGDESHADHEH